MKRLIAVICLLLATGVAGAAKFYRQVEPDGTVVFTDQRPAGEVEELEIPEVQTYEAPAVPDEAAGRKDGDDGFKGYREFAVVRPAHDETIRDNNGVVPIKLSLSPALQRDHKVEIMMDGQLLGSGRSMSITLKSVDRGAHAVEAKVVDEDGNELMRTAAITFHLQRVSRLIP